MKKLILLFTLIPSLSFGQAFQQNKAYFSGGYGIGTITGIIFNFLSDNSDLKTTSVGPIYVKGEYAITDHFGIGLNVAYMSNSATWLQYNTDSLGNQYAFRPKISRKTYSVLLRANYHFGSNEHFDPYIGLGLGYRTASWNVKTNDPYLKYSSPNIPTNLIPLGAEFTIGFRYLFNENIGVYCEAGAAKSVLQFGLVTKF